MVLKSGQTRGGGDIESEKGVRFSSRKRGKEGAVRRRGAGKVKKGGLRG